MYRYLVLYGVLAASEKYAYYLIFDDSRVFFKRNSYLRFLF